MTIRFGTDGWRAVIAETFTFSNLRLVAQAVADYVNNDLIDNGQTPEVVIGYDTRFLSDRFAAEVARVMAGNGIIAWLTRTDTPTPALSYNVKAKAATAGVMITASHNPPRYNGFKLKASYGGAASSEASRRVEHYLERLQNEVRGPNMIDLQRGLDNETIRRFDPSWSYYEHLSTLVDLDVISQGELRIIADPMFGSGRGAIREFLGRTRCHVREIRGYMNPGFEGIHPEPIRKHLDLLAAAIQQDHADVGIATDGDADRIGAMDNQGEFVSPHQIMALALRHLVEKRGMSGQVVKTVSTTAMINRIAAQHNLTVFETPVGFSYIADHMMNGSVLIGGEESGGISIQGHLPEGDGVLMGLLLLEIMADAGRGTPLSEILADLQAKYGPTHYKRLDLHLKSPVAKKELAQRLSESAPGQMAGQRVQDVQTTDGIKYVLADESWLLIRPSGTEPVLRLYAEATAEDAVSEMLAQAQTFIAADPAVSLV
ncbi:MAG: phosphoglucomutase/phosphomannomutase family protein [Chloroflexi bacterium]|nr:phosphoglucomutase/phosphomannomutase family protein [Chloroflexota bacterium]